MTKQQAKNLANEVIESLPKKSFARLYHYSKKSEFHVVADSYFERDNVHIVYKYQG